MNLPRTHEKLHCKGEPYRLSGKRDTSVQTEKHTDKQTQSLLLYYIENLNNEAVACTSIQQEVKGGGDAFN